MTLWIGLTGGIGSGKSQAAKIFSDLGVPHIDADALSRNLTADNGIALPAIRRLFGDKVFHTQNSLNRAALRDIVFRRPQAKKELEEVLLPLILNEIKSAKKMFTKKSNKELQDIKNYLFRKGYLFETIRIAQEEFIEESNG